MSKFQRRNKRFHNGPLQWPPRATGLGIGAKAPINTLNTWLPAASEGEGRLSGMVTKPGGTCPGGVCPGGTCRGGTCPGGCPTFYMYAPTGSVVANMEKTEQVLCPLDL